MASALGAFCLGGPPAVAHHSTAGIYNEDTVVEISGRVKEWRFVNPHPSLIIEVEGPDGEIQEWDISYGGPAVTHLKRQGYTAETFAPGDEIVARGYAAKVETAYGLLILGHPTRVDGSSIIDAQP
ncbi:MAG: DUF6152 family protein, partial [Gammaproteobacteria bacterium]|jgi:hypothetical protein